MIPTAQLGQFGRTISGAASGDPYFSDVVLLLHLDGTNGSTTFIDSSSYARTMTGSARSLTTANFKFGTAAVTSVNSGSGSITAADDAAWHFAAGQFTIECWCRWTTAPHATNVEGIVQQWAGSGSRSWRLSTRTGGLGFDYSTDGTATSGNIRAAWSPTLNQWYHIAVDRDSSNTVRVYVDGAVHATASAGSDSLFNAAATIRVTGDITFWGFAGQLDELRITKNVARYAGAFTPPTTAFPDF